MPYLYFTSLCLMLSLLSTAVYGQHLFGNPSCSDWQKLSNNEKTTWLNAYLVPLNLTNVSRKKPRIDKFALLPSLEPVVLSVDHFCISNTEGFASVGAIQFLDELTADTPVK